MFVPALISQVKDFVIAAPSIFDEITDFIMNLIHKVDVNGVIDLKMVKKNITDTITDFGLSIGSDMPKYLFTFGKSVISGGVSFVLGLMIGFYLLYDFEKANTALNGIIPVSWQDGYKELTNRINTSLRGYVQGDRKSVV